MADPKVRIEVDTSKRLNVTLVSGDKTVENLKAMDLYVKIKPALRKFTREVERALKGAAIVH
jgi:hypothetical protein